MVPASLSVSKQRSERRIAVRLPLKVRGRDRRGVTFEEETSSENLCRNGAAFVTRFDVAIGSDLEIRIPTSYRASRRGENDFTTQGCVVHVENDFATQGRVVYVTNAESAGQHLIGVQFTGPRFQRVFRSESAA
jgi:PilZ domain